MDILNRISSTAQYIIDGKVDFVAQQQIERTTIAILSLTTLLSFLLGYFAQSLLLSIASFSTVLLALLLAFVPVWPYLNRHPVQWRASVGGLAPTVVPGWGTDKKDD